VLTVRDGEVVDEIITGTIEQGESQDFSIKLDPSGKITIEEIPREEPDQVTEDNTLLAIGVIVVAVVIALTILLRKRRKVPT